jgi:hypothetical protein
MDKATRNAIERATQQARKLLDEDFSSQLEGTFDVLRNGVIAKKGGVHLSARQQFQRDKIVAAIDHKRAAGSTAPEAVTDYVRDAAFTTLNRFVALKMLESRQLVQECITKGEQSSGYREFCGMAPGIALLPDAAGYRLYIESLFDEFSTEIKVLFDRRDAASVLWPKRQTFEALLVILNASDLSGVWGEDETIGWVYQFFNSGDERRKMRDESQAPRNSRELAVRNQFFTPRYVVQFLVDNTLGRLWMEMSCGHTSLTEFCEYLVRNEDEPAEARMRKDPRDLRVLDPACGSGHFLLYSFDLLLRIYEEAWTTETVCPKSDATGRSLREDYPAFDDLRQAVPRLIVEHNLYGVDIDPRCAQIAALALWLRAQRAWKDLGSPAPDRPRIRRTHIVVAEPMPGDPGLIDEFAEQLDPLLLRDLFKKMVSESRLAGELGTLLRTEDSIAAELRRAREQFVKQSQTTTFLPGMEPVVNQGSLDLSSIDDDRFFYEAEARIVATLREFAETATGSANVRRRLFADDAVQGVALLDLVRTRFDIVLMNPPFGACSVGAKRRFEKSYPRTKNDVYAAFVERGVQLLHPQGLLGAITSRTGFFLSSFQKWREEVLLKEAPPVIFADLGYGVLDSAMVEVAAYCLEKGRDQIMDTVFLRVLEADDKASALKATIHQAALSSARSQRFTLSAASFSAVPRSPFAYWVSDNLRRLFKALPSFEAEGRTAKQGLATGNDPRFLRVWWEVSAARSSASDGWSLLVKGGAPTMFFGDPFAVVKWFDGGLELKAFASWYRASRGWGDQWSAMINATEFYFQPGFTWPLRASRFAPSVMPAGCAFSTRGCAGFAPVEDLPWLISIMSSSCFDLLFKMLLGRFGHPEFTSGALQEMPIPDPNRVTKTRLATLFVEAWSRKRSLETCLETSHAFLLPSLLQAKGDTLATRARDWEDYVSATETEVTEIQAEIDTCCFDLYGIDDSDRRAITQGFGSNVSELGDARIENGNDPEADDPEDDNEPVGKVDPLRLAADLLSWAVGTAFGRFDVRFATGARPLPIKSKPFDQLLVCSPAMLTADDRLPINGEPAGYSLAFAEDGVLVGDPGHARDIIRAVRLVFEDVFKEDVDSWWDEVATMFDPNDHDLGSWVALRFFEHHLKCYSKSRRKAPIFWQLSVPSGRYSIWLYAHRLTSDSFFQVQNDVITPKLAHEERQLTSMAQALGANPSAKDRKEIATQETFVEELRSFLGEVKRVAPLWNPMLDDGILLTMASLWRLVPQHKPWQRELKSKWDDLVAGKYDWSHVAMHLWPERVIPKCAIDRSLAIAHGLEGVFWVEGGDGKWKPRPTSTRPVAELLHERTSIAVKAALKELTEASATGGQKARTRRSVS